VRIRIVTPAPPGSRQGNRVSAMRWARTLRALGHRVVVATGASGAGCDVLVALHARKSAAAVRRSKREAPARPVVLALTGTDLYRDLRTSAAARESVRLADRLVVLQPLALKALPAHARSKARVVHQSVAAPAHARRRRGRGFLVGVLGHLRPVKDPFLPAAASRLLPAESRIAIRHAGAALSPAMAARARREAARSPRWRFVGPLSRAHALALLDRSRVFVLPSRLEGGANAVGEAIVHGVPVLATRVAGSVGLLGPSHPGYFPVGDARALARLLRRAEADPRFLASLARSGASRASLFRPARERAAWRALLREIAPTTRR
jgi:putative glycosyltransferase (TIGR04348 family)